MTKFKKTRVKIMSILTTAAMALSMAIALPPVNAFAASQSETLYFKGDGKLYIGTSDSTTTEYTGTGWSANGKTLTLDNFSFETTAEIALSMAPYTTLHIEKGSTNTIKALDTSANRSVGIDGGNLTITGTGKLDVASGSTHDGKGSSAAISDTGNLQIVDTTVHAACGKSSTTLTTAAILGGSLYSINANISGEVPMDSSGNGIRLAGYLSFAGGKITAKAPGSAVKTIFNPLVIKGDIRASSNYDGTLEAGTVSSDGMRIVTGTDPSSGTEAKYVEIVPSAAPEYGALEVSVVTPAGDPFASVSVMLYQGITFSRIPSEKVKNVVTYSYLPVGKYTVKAAGGSSGASNCSTTVQVKKDTVSKLQMATVQSIGSGGVFAEEPSGDLIQDVYGLEQLFLAENRVEDDDKGITEADVSVLTSMGTVSLKPVVTDSTKMTPNNSIYFAGEDVKLLTDKVGDYTVLMDTRIVKSITPYRVSSPTKEVALTELAVPVQLTFDLTGTELAGKALNQIAVYRYHNGVDELTATLNADNEGIISMEGNILTVQSKKFSLYTFGLKAAPTPTGFSGSGGNHFSNFWITATAGSNGTITPSGETKIVPGEKLVYKATPNEGYVIDMAMLDGTKEVTLINGEYTFENVNEPYSLHVTFKKASGAAEAPAENAKPVPAAPNPATGDSLFAYLFTW